MTTEAFGNIIKIVETKLGLKPHSMSMMIWKDRIHERMSVCQIEDDEKYLQILQNSSEEMQALIELMINSETWFFREKKAFDYLSHRIRKEIRPSFLKVLCLACSSGEEPYSIAITLYEAGLAAQNFKIDALDISKKAIERAEKGEYREKSFREKDLSFREQAFESTSAGWSIKESIKKQVDFYFDNLVESQFRFELHSYQIIFCRNLLIYLHQKAQRQVLNLIRLLLDKEGILLVSSAETEIVRKSGFEPISFQGAYAFKLESLFR